MCIEFGFVVFFCEMVDQCLIESECYVLVGGVVCYVIELQVDDVVDFFFVQCMEDDDFVDVVEEFGLEMVVQYVYDFGFGFFVFFVGCFVCFQLLLDDV